LLELFLECKYAYLYNMTIKKEKKMKLLENKSKNNPVQDRRTNLLNQHIYIIIIW